MIKIIKNNVNNKVNSCRYCEFYQPQDLSVGQQEICLHPLFYDDNDDLIEELKNSMNEAMNNPCHCCLMDIIK